MTYKGGRPKADPRAVAAWARHRPAAIRPLARAIEISQPAVSKWRQVPRERLAAVAGYLQCSPELLRPDLYPDPWSDL